jgi:hypothetical protein
MTRTVSTYSLIVLLALSSAARGDRPGEAIEAALARGEMHRYFDGERTGGIWLMSAGAPAVALGTGLLFQGNDFARGLAYTELAMGAVEFIGGLVFYLNTRSRIPRFDRQLSTHPVAFRDGELARIRRVNRDMRLLESVEVALFLAGGAMTGAAALREQDLLAGIGTGLMLNSAILFLYDQFAARRALRYTESLIRFRTNVSIAPGPHAALLTLTRSF